MNWQPPETAPKDGTPFLGDFGWPWVNFAVWDECDEEWSIATWQACPMEGGKTNSWIETDTEEESALKQWMPLPGKERKSMMHCQQCGEPRLHDHQCTETKTNEAP